MIDRIKKVNLFDGVVDLKVFEILLRDGKTRLKIFREDNEKQKKRQRPAASGPLEAIKSEVQVNKKDGKYFNFWQTNKGCLDKITTYLKKEDLEWLGFNWFRLRVGLLIFEGQRKTTKL